MNKDKISSIMFYLCTLCGFTGIYVFRCICAWIDNVQDLRTLIMSTISVVVLLAFNVFMFIISKKDICEEFDCKEEEQKQKQMQEELTRPVKKFLYIEDGSVDTDTLIEELAITNPEIRVVVYRQGTTKPELLELGEK